MRVITEDGAIELGTVETAPTIGITDYSRRVTDDFGVTTVVQRGFARRMSVMLAVPLDQVDDVQRQLAELRATEATWIADDRFASLSVQGFYKDFEVTLNSALGLIPLTIEGTAETGSFADPGGDPAVEGGSTLRMVDPIDVDDAVLVSSSVAENDAPAWSAGTNYAKGARVIVAAAHRIYESLVAANLGNNPAGTSGKWLDVGPTGRWAMFDQALGTSTIASSAVEVVLAPGAAISALAVLDTNAATVRVRAPGYDRTQAPNGAGKALFLDLAVGPTEQVLVTLTPAGAIAEPRRWDDGASWMDQRVWRDSLAAGDGTVTTGTMLLGQVKGLGVTEEAPTAGITDYSRKVTDDFGEVTVVPRAWAKRMSARALIRTDAIDLVANRLAAVRARPCLWLGQEDVDSLTVYGFFKDFEITVGETVSKLSLSIEGLSTAGKVQPLGGSSSVDWPDVGDPTGTKPADNADVTGENTSKDTNAVGGKPAGEVLGRLEALDTVTIPAINAAVEDAETRITAARSRADLALTTIASEVSRVDTRIDNISASGGYDDTAVYAEVGRVDSAAIGRDAALGTRVDTVTATITTTDSSLRALIQTKDTAAVDRDNAISQRIDTLVAEGGGGSEGVDTVARSEISRVETAAITRDTALASRADVLEASATGPANSINGNPNFAFWPVASTLPTLWSFWANICPVERVANGNLGGYIAKFSADTAQHGIFMTITTGAAWVVLEADVLLEQGTYVGSGMTLSGSIPFSINFATEADTNGVISETGPARRKFSKLFQLPGGDPNLHAMNNWNGFAPGTAKKLGWYRCALRAASDAEIKAGKADAALFGTGGVLARLTATDATLADLPNRYAAVSRTAALEAQVNFAADSGLQRAVNARIEDRATAIADAKTSAVASTVATLRADYNGTAATVSTQAGAIAGLNGKTAAYVRFVADAGSGRAALSLWSDAFGGAWSLTGDGLIAGNLTIDGSLTVRKLDRSTMTAYTQGAVSGLFSGGYNSGVRYVPGLGASMSVRDGGTFYFSFTGFSGVTDSSKTATFNSIELLDVAGGVLQSIPLPYSITGPLQNHLIRIPNIWGERTIQWRIATRGSAEAYSDVSNPNLNVSWNML